MKILRYAIFLLACLAYSQTCQTVVNDYANVLGSGKVKVEASVQNLVNIGADVRVVVIDKMNTPTLDEVIKELVLTCGSWQAQDHGMKNNLIVVAAAIQDRKSGIYFGNQWKEELRSIWPNITSRRMAPAFRDGRFADGFVAALDAIGSRIRIVTPVPNSPPATVVVETPTSEPTDYSGFWKFLTWILVLGCIGVCVKKFLEIRQDRREYSVKVLKEQQAAISVQQKATSLIAEYSSGIENDINQVPLAKASYDSAITLYSSLGYGMSDPTRKDLNLFTYVRIQDDYKEVIAGLNRAKEQVMNSNKSEVVPAEVVKVPYKHIHQETHASNSQNIVVNSSGPIVEPVTRVIPVYVPSPPVVVVDQPYYDWRSSDSPKNHDDDSGGSSSWGSSSSGGSSDFGSSSSSDWGGSSDFGSSSSDFGGGGGGSSDW